MGVKLISDIRVLTGLKNYGISKNIRELGIPITTQGIDSYEKESAKSMRLDVLCALRQISGKDWEIFGEMLDREFFKRTKRE